MLKKINWKIIRKIIEQISFKIIKKNWLKNKNKF